jgi:DNA-binding transcriptional LysR family regulator
VAKNTLRFTRLFKTPKSIHDLAKHHCLDHADNHSLSWQLQENGKPKNVGINSQIKVNSSLALKELAIQGMGIVYLPSFTVNEAISAKKLKPFLKAAWQDPLPIYALYPQRKRTNKKITVVIDALKTLLNL